MLGEPRYVENSFSIVFPRQSMVRRKANDLEDCLKDRYAPPQVIPVPDELDPEVPRILFTSLHGFSQIAVSQISCTLSVRYSPDYQTDSELRRQYLLERVATLHEVLDALGGVAPHFTGMTTRVRIAAEASDEAVVGYLAGLLLKDDAARRSHDVQVKVVHVIEGRFFDNVTIQNYRSWSIQDLPPGVPALPDATAMERGVEVIGDLNDRYAYNQTPGYSSSRETAQQVLSLGFQRMEDAVARLKGQLP